MATFTGTSQKNTFTGSSAADTFKFSVANLAAIDTVTGGGGSAVDTLEFTTAGTISSSVFANTTEIERIILANGTNSLKLTNTLVGSAHGDLLSILGGSGNDTIDGSTVTTSANKLDITAGAGTDKLTGGAGADTFRFKAADLTSSDTVIGGGGTDTLLFTSAGTIGSSDFSKVSGIEKITLANGTNSVTLTNTLVGNATGDLLLIIGGSGSDSINGAAVMTSTNKLDIKAGAGSDNLVGGLGADIFRFKAIDLTSSDTINGGGGSQIDKLILTTAGDITASDISHMTGIEQIILANGTNKVTLTDARVGSAAGSKLTVIGGTGSDTIVASAVTTPTNKVVLDGGSGNDTFKLAVEGLSADDTVTGGSGADDILTLTTEGVITAAALTNVSGIEQIQLADGASTLTLTNAFVGSAWSDLVTVSGGNGITVDAGTLTSPNEIVVIGSAGADTVIGGAGNDTFYGNGGLDALSAGDGNDVIYTAVASGLSGYPIYLGGGGNDRLEYNVADEPGISPLIGGGLDNDTLFDLNNRSLNINLGFANSDQTAGDYADIRSFENVDWSESSGVLIATGSTFANRILGGGGPDRINGNGGADVLDGGENQDTLVGSGTAIAIVDLSIKGGDQTIADSATVRNFESVDWSLSSGSLIAKGTSGADVMIGGAGTDQLEGRLGADVLTGGGSADVFIWRVREAATDELTDFLPGTDKLQFVQDAFDFNGETLNVTVTTNSSSTFSVAGADIIRLTDTVNDITGVAVFLGTNGTGSDGEGVFVIAQASSGKTYLYHVEDAGNPSDIVRIAELGTMAANTVTTSDFVFV